MLEMLLNNIEDNGIVPVMTANTHPDGYVASASTVYTNTTPSRAVWEPYTVFARTYLPENIYRWGAASSTAGSSTGVIGAVNQWLMIKLPEPEVVSSYAIKGDSEWGLIDYSLQGSDDGVTFIKLHELLNRPKEDWGVLKKYETPNTRGYKYYRIAITKVPKGTLSIINRLYLYK